MLFLKNYLKISKWKSNTQEKRQNIDSMKTVKKEFAENITKRNDKADFQFLATIIEEVKKIADQSSSFQENQISN